MTRFVDPAADRPRIIRWEEPAPSQRERAATRSWEAIEHAWDEVAEELQFQRRRWAMVARTKPGEHSGGVSNLAHRIRYGLTVSFQPPGSFEATTRRLPDKSVAVYARYVGKG